MESQTPSSENMSVSEIAASTSVKEVHGEGKNYLHIFLLLIMTAVALFIVGLSVYNFQGNLKPEVQAISAEVNHSNDLQKLTDH